jgi:phenylacetic acid degradation protein
VGANALIGINSVVLDGAIVGAQSVVGAMSFVPRNGMVQPQTLVVGIPACVVRTLTESELQFLSDGERAYRDLTGHRMQRVEEPLRATSPERLEQRIRSIAHG